jgi:hypothetical protein
LLFGITQLNLDALVFLIDKVHRDNTGEVPLSEVSLLVIEVVDQFGMSLALPL